MNNKEAGPTNADSFNPGTVRCIGNSVNFRTLIGFVVSAVLLWLTLYNSGLTWQSLTLKREQWLLFFAAVISFTAAVWIQSVRTRLIWKSEKIGRGRIHTYTALIIGNFYNSILPGNLGEGARAWYFSKKHKISFSFALSVVFTEKWIDAQIFVLLTIILLVAKPFVGHYVVYALVNTAIAVFVIAVIYYLIRRFRRIEKLLWLVILNFKKPGRFLYRMYWYVGHQVKQLRQDGTFGYFMVLGIFMMLLNMLQFFLLLKAAGVSAPVDGLYTTYLIALSMMIISVIPSAPSNIGVIHYGIYSVLILAATQYGIKPDSVCLQRYALFTVYLHLSYFVPEVLLGIYYVIKERTIIFGS